MYTTPTEILLAIAKAKRNKSKSFTLLSVSVKLPFPAEILELRWLEELTIKHIDYDWEGTIDFQQLSAGLPQLERIVWEADIFDDRLIPDIPGVVLQYPTYERWKAQFTPSNIRGIRFWSHEKERINSPIR